MAGPRRRREAAAKSKETESVSTETTADRAAPPTSHTETNAKRKLDKSGLYDMHQVKRLLDDELIACMEDQGYQEATLVSNVRIVAGSLAVGAALYSHFGPGEFPANKTVVFACVAFYLYCMIIINIFSFSFESSAIFVGHLAKRAMQVSKGNLAPKVWVMTSFDVKGSSSYHVELQIAPRRKHDAVSSSYPYEKYITTEGSLLKDLFRKDVKDLLRTVPTEGKENRKTI